MSDHKSDTIVCDVDGVELTDFSCHKDFNKESEENFKILIERQDTFSKYLADQQKLFKVLEDNELVANNEHSLVSSVGNSEEVQSDNKNSIFVSDSIEKFSEGGSHSNLNNIIKTATVEEHYSSLEVAGSSSKLVIRMDKAAVESVSGVQKILAELPNNAYVFLTLPQRLLSHLHINTEQLKIESESKKKKVVLDNARKQQETNTSMRAYRERLEKFSKSKKTKGLPTIHENEVDSAIPFSCITTPEVVASCNTTSSTSQSSVAVDPKPRSVISSSFNGLPLSRPNYGSTASTTQEEYKKSLDENGNSVQGYNSPLSGSSQQKKLRRKKSSKNETVIKSHQIDGYQGNKNLDEVLRFIESNADTGRTAHKLPRAKHKDDSDDKGGKKRSTERRKEKENKMKRATSMEELSRTKLEDLTDKPAAAERWADGGAPKPERRSWGDDSREAFYLEEAPPDADFQTVTKKRKPRRRTDEAGECAHGAYGSCGQYAAYGHALGGAGGALGRCVSPRTRRVSAPPSDRSNDSNDDMDSVHSLPADAPQQRGGAGGAGSAAAFAHPQSYADIARTRHNIPDLIESCNFYAEGEGVSHGPPESLPAPAIDAEYPALEPRPTRRAPRDRDRDTKPAPPTAIRRDRKMQERTEVCPLTGVTSPAGGGGGAPASECPAPDVVADRRPPVILLDSAQRPIDMDGVTFGFDINEQLLGGPARRPRCDLVRDAMDSATPLPAAVPVSVPVAETNGVLEPAPAPAPAVGVLAPATGVGVGGVVGVGVGGVVGEVVVALGCASLRWVSPRPAHDALHLHQIIDYVGAAWDDVVRCGGGKVRYFTE